MIVKDVLLTQRQIVNAKFLSELFRKYEPACAVSFEGVKRKPETFGYQLRFLVDEECLAKRQFPAPDYELGADFVIEDEDDL